MSLATVMDAINQHEARFVDLRFADISGKEQHITIPAHTVDEEFVEFGRTIDGSSFKGWQKIHQSDLMLVPDTSTIFLDPFFQDNTIAVRCIVVDPNTMKGYNRCPRSLALRAEQHLINTGIADTVYFGPEPEFFVFDDVRFETKMNKVYYELDSDDSHWNSAKIYDGGNIGHRPGVKGGYFPVPPVDAGQDLRSEMVKLLENMGISVEAHHHEVAGTQHEISTRFASLTKKADELLMLKYVVHNVAHNYGKTATFMPKPLVGDNGNGMHCHQSLAKNGVNLFAGDLYSGLSETALFYIGGIIAHARTLNAFTNPSTNSYRRLVPGFEAPVLLAYSARNRSAAIRIPYVASPKARRIEVRFPDPVANPYLAFSAMLMAGLDGIKNKIHPGDAIDKDLYELPEEELKEIPSVCSSLDEALDNLKRDQAFLLDGGVFTPELIKSYISIKSEEVSVMRSLVHPYEFEMYYSM